MNKFFIMIMAMFAMVTVAKADIYITVDKLSQQMYVQTPQGDFVWPVSTARQGYRTPVGDFTPTSLQKMHYSKKYDNAPMPHSIFFLGGYAIHATYDVHRLGTPASHGCVRLAPQNARWLYSMVQETGMKNTHIRIQ